ncbi:Fic family protein [Bacteroides kribbi]|uniref:Fic family protein n=1 Tax=Bacteroidaceae TaxID=815 RepID=UPI0039B6A650
MNIDNLDIIKQLTAEKENEKVEFKETTGQLERGMETLCAFLNGEGGTVLFGVTDKGKIIGQDLSDKTKREIAEAINRLEPTAAVQISYVPLQDSEKKVITFHVEDARLNRPFCYKGRAYMRVESVTTTMPQSRYNELLIQREEIRHGWETYPNTDLKLTDLDETEIRKTVRLGVECGRLPETTGSDISTILEKLEVLENGVLKNAAAVLFAKKKLAHYPQNLLRLARFKGTDKTVFIDNQRVHGNLFQLLDAAMSFIFKHLSLSGTTDTLEREEHLEIPYKAIREAVINALCHRSYRDAGGSVAIAIYDDRVEIENPGSFPSGWDMKRIKSEHGSKPRNPLIADTLYIRKVLESWGRGINLMIEECQKSGLPEPEYQIAVDEVKLIFRHKVTGQEAGQVTGQVTGQEAGQVTGQVMLLVSALGNDVLSLKEIMERLSLKGRDNFLTTYLNPALKEGLIEQTHPENPKHRNQKYRLTETGKVVLLKVNG